MKSKRFTFVLAMLVPVLTGCLPDELSNAQLASFCKVAGDCASYPDFACFQATCNTDNQCVKGEFKGPGAPCHTSTCTANCVCSGPANKSVPVGTCGMVK